MLTASEFIIKSTKDVSVIVRKSDKYVCATAFCSQFGKRIHDLIKINPWNITIKAFQEAFPNTPPTYELYSEIPSSMKRMYSGIYCNIKLIPYMVCWANPSKQFVVNEILMSLTAELDRPSSISEQVKQVKEITTDIGDIGRAGEVLVFDKLKAHFSDLIDCHTHSHASDFYSPYYNVRFEIKTKEALNHKDYEKILTDDRMNQPNVTVVISNVLKVPPHIEVLPNILFIHADELFQNMETVWKPFITSSKWERAFDVAERINAGIIRKETLQLSQTIKLLNPDIINGLSKIITASSSIIASSSESAPTSIPKIESVEEQIDMAEQELQKSEDDKEKERDTLYEQISGIKESLANAIDIHNEKEVSVKGYLYKNEKKFLKGGDSKHIMRDYGVYCRRCKTEGFEDELDILDVAFRFCVRYLPITTPKGNTDRFMIFKYTETSISLIATMKLFVSENGFNGKSNVRDVYNSYKSHEKGFSRPFLAEESFIYEYGLLFALPNLFLYTMEEISETKRKREATKRIKRESNAEKAESNAEKAESNAEKAESNAEKAESNAEKAESNAEKAELV